MTKMNQFDESVLPSSFQSVANRQHQHTSHDFKSIQNFFLSPFIIFASVSGYFSTPPQHALQFTAGLDFYFKAMKHCLIGPREPTGFVASAQR